MWLWIGIGLGAFFAVSVLVGAGLAAMLGAISRGVTELHEERLAVPPTVHRRTPPRRRRADEQAARPLVELELRP